MSTIGQSIIKSLDQVKAWIGGQGTLRITLPTGEVRDMTNAEYADWMKANAANPDRPAGGE